MEYLFAVYSVFSFSHSEVEVFFLHGCIIKKLIHVYKAKFALN